MPGRHLVPTALGQALVKGYCMIDPELVLPQVRSNIEKSCELVAKGRADFNRVINHVLKIFKDKFNFFKLSAGTMERLLNIMLNLGSGDDSAALTSQIPLKHESAGENVNFCIRCFKGHFCLQYHPKKGWGLKCDPCHFATRICHGAARVRRAPADVEKCQECGSWPISVVYTEHSPFPAGQTSHTGCILCDTWLRSTIRCQPPKQPKLMTAMEAEEAQRIKEERKKQKEEKRAQKAKEAAAGNTGAGGAGGNADGATKKKKKSGKNKGASNVDLLTAEERMNEFMKRFND